MDELIHFFVLSVLSKHFFNFLKIHQQMTMPTKDALDFPDFSHFSKVYLFQIVI